MSDIQGYETDQRIPVGEASRILGVSITTLRRWEREGRITPGRTPGGQRRYSVADIEALISSGEPPALASGADRKAAS